VNFLSPGAVTSSLLLLSLPIRTLGPLGFGLRNLPQMAP
jgi:hypothetical protein